MKYLASFALLLLLGTIACADTPVFEKKITFHGQTILAFSSASGEGSMKAHITIWNEGKTDLKPVFLNNAMAVIKPGTSSDFFVTGSRGHSIEIHRVGKGAMLGFYRVNPLP